MSLLSGILPKKEQKDYFLILGVETHHIRAIVGKTDGEKVEVVGWGESDFSQGQDETEAADIAISMAEKEVPQGFLVEKVIFALPTQYVEEDRVKPEYLTRLKKITKTLNLAPHGFVEYQAAIAYYLESDEGSALSAILLSVDAHQLIFTLLRLGKIQRSFTMTRTESLSDDLVHAISDFKVDILPSRIILYDEGANLETIKEEMLKFPWHKQSAFLHTPKIEILIQDTIIKSLVAAASSSLIEASSSLSQHTRQQFDTKHEQPHHIPQVPQQTENLKKHEPSFGFVHDKTAVSKEAMQEHANIEIPPKTAFSTPLPQKQTLINRIIDTLKNIRFPDLPPLPTGKPLILISAIFFAIIVIGAITLTKGYSSAKVHVLVLPQKVTSQIDVTFAKSGTKANSVQVEAVTTDATGDGTAQTTGKTQVGEKARGEVVVYNKTTSSKTLPKSSILVANNLQFTLDDTIQIASASDTGEGLTFGKLAARVSAAVIGPGGNLPSNTTLTFKDFSDSQVTAKATQGFSGGTARDVGSVSREDQNKLEDSLRTQLTTKLKQELTSKLAPGQKLLAPSMETKVASRKFSAEIGSESKTLSLSMTVTAQALVYRQDDLTKLSSGTIPVPSGFEATPARTSVTVESINEEKDGSFSGTTLVASYFIPKLDVSLIKGEIAGKSYEESVSYMQTLPHVAGVRITQIKKVPFQGNHLPKKVENIDVVVQGL